MLGRTLGDFVIRERIGAGGVGEVFRAEQTTLGREAVIKVLTRNRELSSQAADRFLREARLASRLDHPFAAHIYAFGAETDGMLWIAMELVRGIPLDRLISTQGPVPLSRFVPFFERLAEVLYAAHEQGIVHRDVKPANVMVLSRTGRLMPKLLDLGIARTETVKVAIEPIVFDLDSLSDAPLAEDEAHTSSELLISKSTDITQAGMVIGTPHFMAPEQWSDASKADVRSDVYSLAILAYQAITGRLPFKGHSIRSMARAHAQQVLPPLGETLPEALYPVLARATAKRPSDRYANALEFSAAFRGASGLDAEPASMPHIDDSLRETVLAKAPQPIAEAVAMLEAARTPRQGVDAAAAIQRVVTRHVAMMALAARARIGAGAEVDSEEVVSLIKRSAAGRIDDDAWRALTAGLCLPFAHRRKAHPIPELVAVFFNSDARPGMGALALDRLAQMPWPTLDSPQDELIAFLHQAIPAVSQVLSTLSFIFDYPLVVRRNDAERWMGTRRARRAAQDVLGPQPADGEVVLLDSSGSVVLTLSPLLQLIAPSGGAIEELFYLDGPGRHGARMVALPGPFERQDPEMWAWFSAHIADVMSPMVESGPAGAEPYKGLSPFTPEDADNYFGREREAEGFANRLRAEPLLAVVGPSGAGKSSFISAGVLPLLPKGWRSVVVRPGSSPLAALTHRLSVEQLSIAGLATLVRLEPEALARSIAAMLAPGQTLVLVVDQFEELVTLCADVEERQAFARALTASADMPGSRVRVVMTLRDDFLIQIIQLPAFRERLSSALQLLATPAPDDLLRTVVEPARRVGFGFDDETLPRRMVDAVVNHSGALALLSFTASQMWSLRDRQLRQMRAKTYEALGGVGGALAQHAERTLGELPPPEQRLVREAFRQLVTSQGTRAVLSRKELLEVLGGDQAAQTVFDTMVNARLLVAGDGEGHEDRTEIIHESLIQSWPRLVAWLREDAETARLRDALRASARQWVERGRARGLLWRGETLAEYQRWKTRFIGGSTQAERAFADASIREESRGRLIRSTLAVSAFVALTVGLVVVGRAYRSADSALQKAEVSATEAKHRLASLRQEQGRLAMLDNKPLAALAYLGAAREAGAQGSAIDHMLKLAAWLTRGEIRRFGDGEPMVNNVLSPDEKTLAIFREDGRITLWDVETGTLRVTLEVAGVTGAFAADGTLAIGTRAGRIEFVDSTTGVQTGSLDAKTGSILGLELSATGDLVAVSAIGETARLMRRNGETVASVTSPNALAVTARLSADARFAVFFAGSHLTAQNPFREFVVVDAVTGNQLMRTSLAQPAHDVAFGPKGQMAVALANGEIGVWDLVSKRKLWGAQAHTGAIHVVKFSPGGDRLVSLGADGKANVWNLALQNRAHSLTLSNTPLRHGFWTNDEWFIVELPDGTLQKLSATTGELDWQFVGERPNSKAWRIKSGSQMISVQSGVARVWDAETSAGPTISAEQVIAAFGSPNSSAVGFQTPTDWYVGSGETAELTRVSGRINFVANGTSPALSANGELLARYSDKQLQLLHKDTGFQVDQVITLNEAVVWFAVNDAGDRLAVENVHGVVTVFGRRPFVPLAEIKANNDETRTPGFFTEQGDLLTGSSEGVVERWSESGALISRAKASSSFVFPLQSAVADRWFAVGTNGSVQVRSASTDSLIGVVEGSGVEPLALSLSPTSELLHQWTADGTWSTWQLKGAVPLTRVRVASSLAAAVASRDATTLITRAGRAVRWPALSPDMSDEAVSEAIDCNAMELDDDGLRASTASKLLECVLMSRTTRHRKVN